MNALLVLNNENYQSLRVIATLNKKSLKEKVIALLKENRRKEALEIFKSKAEVKAYIPHGQKPTIKTEITLIEDML